MNKSDTWNSDGSSLSWDDVHDLHDCWLADVSGGCYSVTALPSVCGNGYSVCVAFTIEVSTPGDGKHDIWCGVDNIAESTVPLDEVRDAVERAKSMAEEHYHHGTVFH